MQPHNDDSQTPSSLRNGKDRNTANKAALLYLRRERSMDPTLNEAMREFHTLIVLRLKWDAEGAVL